MRGSAARVAFVRLSGEIPRIFARSPIGEAGLLATPVKRILPPLAILYFGGTSAP